jgi:hypothetical protein
LGEIVRVYIKVFEFYLVGEGVNLCALKHKMDALTLKLHAV